MQIKLQRCVCSHTFYLFITARIEPIQQFAQQWLYHEILCFLLSEPCALMIMGSSHHCVQYREHPARPAVSEILCPSGLAITVGP